MGGGAGLRQDLRALDVLSRDGERDAQGSLGLDGGKGILEGLAIGGSRRIVFLPLVSETFFDSRD